MAKHKISESKVQELLRQKADYSQKLARKHEQLQEIISSTINYAEDPTYASLMERKECYERKLSQIDAILLNHELVFGDDCCDHAEIGKRIVIKNHTHTHEFVLVDEVEADPSRSLVPVESPIGRKVFGRKLNEVFVVETPRGMIDYKIVSITPAF